ncbi:MAG TPA: PH domain-containing protein [Luteibacter sp.]|uniref:PH domain-containing protein n=1 Tax=Luteibacter sp. TaxID=1886636 RepID=UPI002C18D8BE|nr:PH domain-containing protein [Luteibacter sp.]HVI55839.1 PH domain-containing protein [Luteibacter sp.]
MTTFSTSMSATVRWLALTTVAILVVALSILLGHDAGRSVGPPLAGVLVLILLVTYLVSTREYAIGGGKLVVRKVVGSKTFELRGASVGRDAQAFQGMVRVFGNGGFFAFDGLFYSRRLGFVRSYARNREHGVVVYLAGGSKLVLSPDDPEAFVSAALAQGAVLTAP